MPKEIAPAVAECRRLALSHVPRAVEKLAELLNSEDERVVAAAATALMDRAGVAPRAWEGERLEVVATIDADALRASLAQRVAGLVVAREAMQELSLPAPTSNPDGAPFGGALPKQPSAPSSNSGQIETP